MWLATLCRRNRLPTIRVLSRKVRRASRRHAVVCWLFLAWSRGNALGAAFLSLCRRLYEIDVTRVLGRRMHNNF